MLRCMDNLLIDNVTIIVTIYLAIIIVEQPKSVTKNVTIVVTIFKAQTYTV